MNKKLVGILIPIVMTVLTFVIAMVAGYVIASSSTDGWAALGAILIIVFFYGLEVIITYIVALVLYYAKKYEQHKELGQGLLIGMTSVLGASIVIGVIINLYNMFIA